MLLDNVDFPCPASYVRSTHDNRYSLAETVMTEIMIREPDERDAEQLAVGVAHGTRVDSSGKIVTGWPGIINTGLPAIRKATVAAALA